MNLFLYFLSSFITAITIPNGRIYHTSVLKKNKVWIIGGLEKPLSDNIRTCEEDATGKLAEGLWKYDIVNNTWEFEVTPFVGKRGSNALINKEGEVFVFGGGTTDPKSPHYSIPVPEMWKFSNDAWSEIKTNSPPIYGHTSAINNEGHIYSLGGFHKNGRSSYLYVFDGKKWRREDTPFTLVDSNNGKTGGLVGHTMTFIDKRYIYVIGGVIGFPTDKEGYNSDVWSYDTYRNKWKLLCGGVRTFGHSACFKESTILSDSLKVKDDEIYIIGGFYPTEMKTTPEGAKHLDGTKSSILSFNIRTNSWKHKGHLKNPREFHTSVLCDNTRVFVFGGYHIGEFWERGEIVYI
tara:strand:- start:471 stop:1517 length:1047 start_codon:yes stop_codon:yes gene_type:complete